MQLKYLESHYVKVRVSIDGTNIFRCHGPAVLRGESSVDFIRCLRSSPWAISAVAINILASQRAGELSNLARQERSYFITKVKFSSAPCFPPSKIVSILTVPWPSSKTAWGHSSSSCYRKCQSGATTASKRFLTMVWWPLTIVLSKACRTFLRTCWVWLLCPAVALLIMPSRNRRQPEESCQMPRLMYLHSIQETSEGATSFSWMICWYVLCPNRNWRDSYVCLHALSHMPSEAQSLAARLSRLDPCDPLLRCRFLFSGNSSLQWSSSRLP